MTTRQRPLRADAVRNREKLLVAAADVLGERGLDAPLEEVARRAGVSIGTLYNHFPQRGDLIDAIYPARLAEFDVVAEQALADPDPWHGFVAFVEGLFTLQAQDRGLNDAVARAEPGSVDPAVECTRGFVHAAAVIERAHDAGVLRPDFNPSDLATLTWAMSRVITQAPQEWRRCLGFFLDGLRVAPGR
jgi:AcrR family transcriptional regulator